MALGNDAGDESLRGELETTVHEAADAVERAELERMLSGENDRDDAIVTINSGAGGTEAQDWAAMLLRMYARWCETKRYKVTIVDELPGEAAGFKNVTMLVKGAFAYGFLKAEAGVHRLVRISPFDAARRRQTSFASVFIYPDVADDVAVDIAEKDLRVDTYRSSGAGGQHVNKTDSAVRITHLPTGIVVQCQNERSQHKNRSVALKILAARLRDLERQKRDQERLALESSKMRIDFGSQIRSYVLAPYRLVKDHRTGFEMGNADAVLDGELDGFMRAYLLAS